MKLIFIFVEDKRLLNIMLHEIGHVFGLDHSSNPRSIMSPLFRFDTAEIQTEDVRNLRLILGLDKR
jgi:predicted Zn-dependent protease